MIEIKISAEMEKYPAGVYMISFSDGHIYIGCTKNLKNRIRLHISAIKSNFCNLATSESFRKMRGFDGIIEFSLLEPPDKKAIRLNRFGYLFETEKKIIKQYKGNPMLLNIIKNYNV